VTVPGLNVALFIDADNAPSRKLAGVLKILEKIGTVSIRRAYGNWASANLCPWRKVLHEHAIQPIQQFDLTKGKNATDMAMTIDVMDVLYNKSVDVFCLMSSDSDFTPLIMRLRGDGKQVYGFGGPQSPAPFISACSQFHYLEGYTKPQAQPLPAPAAFVTAAVATSDPALPENSDITPVEPGAVSVALPKPYVKHTPDELNAVPGLKTLLIDSVCKVGAPGEWVTLSSVGAHLPKLNVKLYGYPKLVQLMEQFSVFEIKRENTHPLIRMKAKAIHGAHAVLA
jgi:uncharacterized protein (TIGR00288 family)